MGRGRVLEEIEAVAREHIGFAGRLEASQRLVEDLELDSITALTLVVEIENRFRIRLTPADEARIETVGDLVQAVERLNHDAG